MKTKFFFFFSFIFLFYSLGFPSFRQSKTDSLLGFINLGKADSNTVNAYAGLCKEYGSGNFEKAIKYGQEGLQLSKKIRFYKGIPKCFMSIGIVYMSLGNFPQAKEYFLKSLKVSQAIGDRAGVSSGYNALGVIYWKQGNYPLSIKYYQKSLQILEILKDKNGIAKCYNNIGNIYTKQKNYSLAFKYLQEALKISIESGYMKLVASSLLNIGNMYYCQEKDSLALKYYLESFKINKNFNIDESYYLINIGNIYTYHGNYKLANQYYQESLKINKKNNNKSIVSNVLNCIANLRIEEKKYVEAIEYSLQSLIIAKEINALENMKESAGILAKCYSLQGDYKNAFDYQKYFKKINDSIYNITSSKQIKEMEAKYQSEKKEKEITALQKEKTIKELEASKQKNLKFFFMIAGFIFLIAACTLFFLFSQRKKMNVALTTANKKLTQSEIELRELNSTKDKFFAIISHDIRNPLSSFRATTKYLATSFYSLSDNEKYPLINEIYKSSENLYQLFQNLLQWAVSQSKIIKFSPKEMDLGIIAIKTIMITKTNADKKDISLVSEINENTLAYGDVDMVSTIFLNLITNAIKFTGQNGKIYIRANESHKGVTVSIKDTGIGIAPEDISKLFRIEFDHKTIGNSGEKGTGLGLILCKEFIEKNGGKIWVESSEGKGSVFYFTLPNGEEGV